MSTYSVTVTPRRSGAPTGRVSELDVLVRLTAPAAPADAARQRQHALNIACVIDRSGSMAGPPLEEARRCVVSMIERLKPTDRAACVVYDDKVRVLVPSTHVHDPSIFRDALAGVRSGGTTNLHGGWLKGAEQLAGALHEDEIARVILLSDGQANHGLTDLDRIAAQCEELAAAGVSTSTYGLGRHFNEDLMIAMAQRGGGNHYYGETAADLLEPFQEEFDLLQDVCARQVRLRLAAAPGVRPRMLNDYQPAGAEAWRLPDLAYGSEAWALLRLEIDPDALAASQGSRAPLLEVELELVDSESRERRFIQATLTVPLLADDVVLGLPEDELVALRARELDSAALQMRIREAVRQGDWQTAERLLAQAEQDAEHHPWLREMMRTFRHYVEVRDSGQLLKETAYASARLQRRLFDAGEAASTAFDPAVEETKASYLRRKSWQGRGRRPSSDQPT